MFNNSSIGVIILSGGNSSRMHCPKAFLSLGNVSLIEKISNIYLKSNIERSVIILNHLLFSDGWKKIINQLSKKNILIKNKFPEFGRSYSIQLGLKGLKNISMCFIQNVDSPGISPQLLKKMVSVLKTNSYVVPTYRGKSGHPVLIGETIIKHLASLETNEWILKEELKKFERIEVESNKDNVLLNLNTQAEWQHYLESVAVRHNLNQC